MDGTSGMDRREILDKINDREQRYLASRIIGKIDQAEKQGSIEKTDFLDPAQQVFAQRIITQYGRKDLCAVFLGGYEGAERKSAVFFHPEYESDETAALCRTEGLICCFACSVLLPERQAQGVVLSHRDYLGALMGLGIERAKIGDIVTEDQGLRSHLFLAGELAEYVAANLCGVGRYTVSLEQRDWSQLNLSGRKDFDEVRLTVSSLRLDCVLAAALRCSRGKALEMIRAGIVSVNWEKCGSASAELGEGDTLSVKGFGRLQLRTVFGETKKGRIAVLIGKPT